VTRSKRDLGHGTYLVLNKLKFVKKRTTE